MMRAPSVVSDPCGDELHDAIFGERWNLPVLAANSRTAFWYYAVSCTITANDPMTVEEFALALPRCLLRTDAREATGRKPGVKERAWHMERVDEARRLVCRHPEASHSLANLSRTVGISPFHFTRMFHEPVGLPPHRFLAQQRLYLAQKLIRSGISVMEAGLGCGFQNLSHFSRSYRRFFGTPPGRDKR